MALEDELQESIEDKLPDSTKDKPQESTKDKPQESTEDKPQESTETPALIPLDRKSVDIVIARHKARAIWLRVFAFLLLIMVIGSILIAIYALTNAVQLAGYDFRKAVAQEQEYAYHEIERIGRSDC
jgi:hypothetical protein